MLSALRTESITILDTEPIRTDPRLGNLEAVKHLVPRRTDESARAHAERVLAVSRRLAYLNIPPIARNVSDAIAAIDNARERNRNKPVFNETILVASGAVTVAPDSGDSAYITPFVRSGLERLGSTVRYFSGLLPERTDCAWSTEESLTEARDELLEAIRTTETPITVLFKMHGNPELLEFGTVDTGTPNVRAVILRAAELARAFADRYADPRARTRAERTEDVVIFEDCNAEPVAEEAFIDELRRIAEREHRSIPAPFFIASAEKGQLSFRGQLMYRFFSDPSATPTFGMLYPDGDDIGNASRFSNAAVFAHDRRNRPIQIG